MPTLLWRGIELMASRLLSSLFALEISDGAGSAAQTMRSVPAELCQLPAAQNRIPTAHPLHYIERHHSGERVRIIPVSVAAHRRPPDSASDTRLATAR